MKKALALTLLVAAALRAEDCPDILPEQRVEECPDILSGPQVEECLRNDRYIGVGLGPLPLPILCLELGFRPTAEQFGVDLGVNLATIIRYNAARVYLNGIKYLGESYCNRNYLGLGGSIGGTFGWDDFNSGPYFAPNIIFGREFYKCEGKKEFCQIDLMYPAVNLKKVHRSNYYFPLISIRYGWAF